MEIVSTHQVQSTVMDALIAVDRITAITVTTHQDLMTVISAAIVLEAMVAETETAENEFAENEFWK